MSDEVRERAIEALAVVMNTALNAGARFVFSNDVSYFRAPELRGVEKPDGFLGWTCRDIIDGRIAIVSVDPNGVARGAA